MQNDPLPPCDIGLHSAIRALLSSSAAPAQPFTPHRYPDAVRDNVLRAIESGAPAAAAAAQYGVSASAARQWHARDTAARAFDSPSQDPALQQRLISADPQTAAGSRTTIGADRNGQAVNSALHVANSSFPQFTSEPLHQRRALTTAEEAAIEFAAKTLPLRGRAAVLDFANNLLRGANPAAAPVGKHWLRGFLQRTHTSLRKAKNRPPAVNVHSAALSFWSEAARAARDHKPRVAVNFDEFSVLITVGGDNTIAVECGGRGTLSPSAPLPAGKNVRASVSFLAALTTHNELWLGALLPGSKQYANAGSVLDGVWHVFTPTAHGNTSAFLAFVDDVIASLPDPALVLADAANFHKAAIVTDLLDFHGARLLVLPPSTTGYLQPLDRGVFGLLKRDIALWANWLVSSALFGSLGNTGVPLANLHRLILTAADIACASINANPRIGSNAWISTGLYRMLSPLHAPIADVTISLAAFQGGPVSTAEAVSELRQRDKTAFLGASGSSARSQRQDFVVSPQQLLDFIKTSSIHADGRVTSASANPTNLSVSNRATPHGFVFPHAISADDGARLFANATRCADARDAEASFAANNAALRWYHRKGKALALHCVCCDLTRARANRCRFVAVGDAARRQLLYPDKLRVALDRARKGLPLKTSGEAADLPTDAFRASAAASVAALIPKSDLKLQQQFVDQMVAAHEATTKPKPSKRRGVEPRGAAVKRKAAAKRSAATAAGATVPRVDTDGDADMVPAEPYTPPHSPEPIVPGGSAHGPVLPYPMPRAPQSRALPLPLLPFAAASVAPPRFVPVASTLPPIDLSQLPLLQAPPLTSPPATRALRTARPSSVVANVVDLFHSR